MFFFFGCNLRQTDKSAYTTEVIWVKEARTYFVSGTLVIESKAIVG